MPSWEVRIADTGEGDQAVELMVSGAVGHAAMLADHRTVVLIGSA